MSFSVSLWEDSDLKQSLAWRHAFFPKQTSTESIFGHSQRHRTHARSVPIEEDAYVSNKFDALAYNDADYTQ